MKTLTRPAPIKHKNIKINYYPEDHSIKLYRNKRVECRILGANQDLSDRLKEELSQGDYDSFVSMYGERHIGSWIINIISLDPDIRDLFSRVIVSFRKSSEKRLATK